MTAASAPVCDYPGCGIAPRTGRYCYQHRHLGALVADGPGAGSRLRLADTVRLATEEPERMSAALAVADRFVAHRPRLRLVRSAGDRTVLSMTDVLSPDGSLYWNGRWLRPPHSSPDDGELAVTGPGTVTAQSAAGPDGARLVRTAVTACSTAWYYGTKSARESGELLTEEYDNELQAVAQLDTGAAASGTVTLMPSPDGTDDWYRFTSFDERTRLSGRVVRPELVLGSGGELVYAVNLRSSVSVAPDSELPDEKHADVLQSVEHALVSIAALRIPTYDGANPRECVLPVGWDSFPLPDYRA